jgi:hypothetical protein
MVLLKKKILKISAATIFVAFLYTVYCQNFVMEMVDQWID